MSWMPCPDADEKIPPEDAVEMVIVPRTGDIGNFEVHRALPFRDRRMVGPFIFWDQAGPGEFVTGQGLDVRPHPHIGLSTVTYLIKGSLDHKDSLGNDMRIKPGDVNLMTAGQGIVHSERTGADVRQSPSTLFGIQSWLAQPKKHESGAAGFTHIGKQHLPTFDSDGVTGRVIMGEYEGMKSPAPMQWDTLYVDICAREGAIVNLPNTTEERAIYILSGRLEIAGNTYDPQQMLILHPKSTLKLRALEDSHFMLLGGATMDGPRHIWWNFVASDKDMMEQAKKDWKDGKFPAVPGDEDEFIPLPE